MIKARLLPLGLCPLRPLPPPLMFSVHLPTHHPPPPPIPPVIQHAVHHIQCDGALGCALHPVCTCAIYCQSGRALFPVPGHPGLQGLRSSQCLASTYCRAEVGPGRGITSPSSSENRPAPRHPRGPLQCVVNKARGSSGFIRTCLWCAMNTVGSWAVHVTT